MRALLIFSTLRDLQVIKWSATPSWWLTESSDIAAEISVMFAGPKRKTVIGTPRQRHSGTHKMLGFYNWEPRSIQLLLHSS